MDKEIFEEGEESRPRLSLLLLCYPNFSYCDVDGKEHGDGSLNEQVENRLEILSCWITLEGIDFSASL